MERQRSTRGVRSRKGRGSERASRPRRRQARTGAGPFSNPLWIIAILLFGGVVYAAADRGNGLMPWHRLEVEVAEAKARVRGLRVRNAQLAAEIRDLRADPGALEAAIREVIGWVKPGEIRVDVEASEAALPSAPVHP